MERRLAEVVRRVEADPAGSEGLIDLARELTRLGDAPGAVALLGARLDRAPDARVAALRTELLRHLVPRAAPASRVLRRGDAPVAAVAVAPGGDAVALAEARFLGDPFGVQEFTVLLLDLGEDGAVRRERVLDRRGGTRCSLAFSPDGGLVAAGLGGMRAWDVVTGTQRAVVAGQHLDPARVGLARGRLQGSGKEPDDPFLARQPILVSREVGRRQREVTPTPLEGVLLEALPPARRAAVQDRLVDFLQERATLFDVPRWRRARGAEERRDPSAELAGDVPVRGAVDDGGAALALALGSRIEVLDLAMETRWVSRHPSGLRWATPGGGPAVPVALAAGGRVLAIGSGGTASWASLYDALESPGVVLLSAARPGDPLALLPEAWVSALAFDAAGATLAAGTAGGEVHLVDLVERRPTAAPRVTSAARAPAVLASSRGAGQAFGLLARLPPHPVRIPHARLAADDEDAWVLAGRRASTRRVYTSGAEGIGLAWLSHLARRVPLAGSGPGELRGVDEAGRPVRATGARPGRMPLFDLEVAAEPAAPDPAAPPLRGRHIPERRALASALAISPRGYLPAPDGELAAVLASRRDREVWVIRTADPEDHGHLTAEGAIHALAWTPRGDRLVLLLKSGALEVHGYGAREVAPEPRPEGLVPRILRALRALPRTADP